MHDDCRTRIGASLHDIRSAIVALLRERGPLTLNQVETILSATVDIEAALRDDREPEASQQTYGIGQTSKRPRRAPKRYTIESIPGDEPFIAEYRSDSPIPFRSSKGIFDAVVNILADAKAPMEYAEIHSAVSKVLGESLADYPVRLCLRFLSSEGVRLVGRHRARYAAIDRRNLAKAAQEAWERLRPPSTRCDPEMFITGDEATVAQAEVENQTSPALPG